MSPRTRGLALVIAAGIACAGCTPDPDDPDARARALREISLALERRAYATGVDFGRWASVLESHGASVDSAISADDFASRVNLALAGLGVSHLSLLTPTDWRERQSGSRTGLGVTTVAAEGGLLVSRVVRGGAADRAGIKAGDVVLTCDGSRVSKSEDLKGRPGQERLLTWRSRGETRQARAVYCEHRGASPDELTWLDDRVALITVGSFSDRLYDRAQIKRFFDEAAGAEGIVLDLRSNRGGNAENVEHLLAQVVSRPRTSLVDIYRENADEYRRAHPGRVPTAADIVAFVAPDGLSPTVPPDDSVYEGPLAVLVDSHCASGGELAPAVLQHLGRATVVGARTRGKVRIGEHVALAGGYRLQVPIGEMVLADGTLVEGVGIAPDIVLAHDEVARDDTATAAARSALNNRP